jgi:guanylate kinase
MLGVGAWLVLRGELSAGAMIAGSILLGRALAPIEMAVGQWAVVQRAQEGWGRLASLLSRVPADQKVLDLPRPRALLEVQGLSVVPPGEQAAVLKSVTFRLEPGQALGVIGPSGAGKSTLARRLMQWDPAIRFSVSATTRAPRAGEVDGREYHFRSRPVFEAMVASGQMLEHAEVFGNLYGSPRGPVLAAMEAGRDTVFDIDWQGGQQIKQAMRDDVVSIFILPPSIAELDRRLRSRGQDSDEVIAGRMAKSRDEISHWAEYDYVLVNEDLGHTFDRLKAILTAERLRRDRQPQLSAFVRALNEEFDTR